MSHTIAELAFRPEQASIRSVQDVLYDRPPVWQPLYYVRTTTQYTELSVGWTTYELSPSRWEKYAALQEAAQQAFRPENTSSTHRPSYA